MGLSWIGYHAGRDPEIESWAAVLADVARGLGAHAGTAFDHGSQNVTGTAARWLGRIFALALDRPGAAAGPARAAGRRRPRAGAARGARPCSWPLAPVLSPQYLLWLAPLSALLAPRYPLQAVLAGAHLRAHAARAAASPSTTCRTSTGARSRSSRCATPCSPRSRSPLWRAVTAPGSGTPTRPAWPDRS